MGAPPPILLPLYCEVSGFMAMKELSGDKLAPAYIPSFGIQSAVLHRPVSIIYSL